MLILRIRAVVLGLLAVMLAGSVMAATASAEAGPFWHHRNGGEGTGAKIEPKAPENFRGTGGEQILKGTIGTEPVEITASSLQVKGAIFNGPDRGQIKAELIYHQPRLVKPVKPGCVVTVGTNNVVVVKGHLFWKWNGSPAQLSLVSQQPEQSPDIVFSAVEPAQQKPFVEKLDMTNGGTFTSVSLKTVAACGALAGTFNVGGSEVAIPNPAKVEEWSKKLAVRTVETQTQRFFQHFWDQEAYQGALIGLTFAGNPASLIGQSEVEAEQQEVAVFEK